MEKNPYCDLDQEPTQFELALDALECGGHPLGQCYRILKFYSESEHRAALAEIQWEFEDYLKRREISVTRSLTLKPNRPASQRQKAMFEIAVRSLGTKSFSLTWQILLPMVGTHFLSADSVTASRFIDCAQALQRAKQNG
jgi:hypothetical protein